MLKDGDGNPVTDKGGVPRPFKGGVQRDDLVKRVWTEGLWLIKWRTSGKSYGSFTQVEICHAPSPEAIRKHLKQRFGFEAKEQYRGILEGTFETGLGIIHITAYMPVVNKLNKFGDRTELY